MAFIEPSIEATAEIRSCVLALQAFCLVRKFLATYWLTLVPTSPL